MLSQTPRRITLISTLPAPSYSPPPPIVTPPSHPLPVSRCQVELVSKVGALRHMLLELLEHAGDLRRISAISRRCRVNKEGVLDCPTPVDKRLAEGERSRGEGRGDCDT